jgi:hypothetical protein
VSDGNPVLDALTRMPGARIGVGMVLDLQCAEGRSIVDMFAAQDTGRAWERALKTGCPYMVIAISPQAPGRAEVDVFCELVPDDSRLPQAVTEALGKMSEVRVATMLWQFAMPEGPMRERVQAAAVQGHA